MASSRPAVVSGKQFVHTVRPYEPAIVLVDDDVAILAGAAALLESANMGPVLTVASGADLMPLLARQEAAAIVLDLRMPGISGLDLLPEVHREYPDLPVIVMTASTEVETAVSCMKTGAFDYLVKPVEEGRLVSSVRNAIRMHSMSRQLDSMKHSLLSGQLVQGEVFSSIVTVNRRMRSIFQYIEAIVRSREPILISGETGVGKEGIAQVIHRASRCRGELVAVNVAGLDDTVFTDSLFGHRKGAFTGAEGHRDGLIAKAEGGTLFLDEIGDLGKMSQVKLLRLLQEREYHPLGSDIPCQTTARLVMATNQSLRDAMLEGRFRSDLYYRLAVHEIHVPPLRERREDIPLLVNHFLREAANTMGKPVPTIPGELFDLLATYDFPGNIRELRGMVFNAVASHTSRMLSMSAFKQGMRASGRGVATVQHGGDLPRKALVQYADRLPTLRESEEHLVREALQRANDNQGIAASLLGISRQALNRRLVKTLRRQDRDTR
jgi:DNA-binding NtrC family response regulator